MIPSYIVIHHSLTKDGQTVSWGAIRKYHVETLGWNDIGYHFGIELINDHYEILVGRMMTEVGAHCKEQGMNNRSVGICVVGNFDVDILNTLQMEMLVKLVKSIKAVFAIPKANVKQHHEYASYKSCPGTQFPWDQFIGAL
jgi:N-acetylmuramoyl-L-alanine amidase